MSIDLGFHTQRDSFALRYPDDRVLAALRRLDEESTRQVFGICEPSGDELMVTDNPSADTSRETLVTAIDTLLGKLGERGTVQIEFVGFASKFATSRIGEEGGTTPVGSGATGLFQITGSDQAYQLDATENGLCQLLVYERDEHGRFQQLGSQNLSPGTVIQPSSYATSYIVGRRKQRVPIGRELRRLRDFLLTFKELKVRVELVV